MADAGSSGWLRNASFDASLFAARATSSDQAYRTAEPSSLATQRSGAETARAELLAQAESSSDADSEPGGRKRHHEDAASDRHRKEEKRKRKKQRTRDKADKRLAELDARARAAGPRQAPPQLRFAWAEDASRQGRREADCLDSAREGDNLVFEQPYLGNKPAYRRLRAPRQQARDDARQNGRGRRRRRFTTRRAKQREADREAARLRFSQGEGRAGGALGQPPPAFIAFDPEGEGEAGALRQGVLASRQQQLRQRTIQLNRVTTEQPQELQPWLDFADFQEDFFGVAGALREKRARLEREAAQKRVAILQKALQHHPGSQEVVLRLMAAAGAFEDAAALHQRWQALLRDPAFSGSWRLWHAHLRWLRDVCFGMAGGKLTVADVRGAHGQALRALARERLRLLAQVHRAEATAVEAAMVDVLVGCCRFDLQAGHTEAAVARLQACLEFCLLAPALSTAVPGPGGDSVRRPHFERFWDSGAPLIGEEGAAGWQAWALQQQQLQRQKQQDEPPPLPPEPAGEVSGWSGWQELDVQPPLPPEEPGGPPLPPDEEADGSEADRDASADEEDDEMEQLRQQLEEAAEQLQADGGAVSPEVAREWLRWERFRERCRWQPARPQPGEAGAEGGLEAVAASEGAAYADVEPALFSLFGDDRRRSLALRLLGLLGVPLGAWAGSNSEWGLQDGSDAAELSQPLAAQLLGEPADPTLAWLSPDWLAAGLEAPLLRGQGALPWFQADSSRRDLVQRVLELLLTGSRLAAEPCLCAALVAVAAAPVLANTDPSGADEPVAAGGVFEDRGRAGEAGAQRPDAAAVRRALAAPLRQQSAGSPLWTAYATHEALHGSVKIARKTFAMHLQNASGAGDRAEAASLAHAWAAAEAQRQAAGFRPLALHVLAWLACGRGPFQPPPQPPPPLPPERVAVARRSFQTLLAAAVSGAALSSDQAAAVAAAALFEQLADGEAGAGAAARLLHNALAAFPTEVRRQSPELERLELQRCRLLVEAGERRAAAPGEAYRALDDALQLYPRSLECLRLLLRLESAAFVGGRLRRHLRAACDAQPLAPLWLLAARLEARLLLPQHRMRQLFKRAEAHAQLDHSPLWQRVQLAWSGTAAPADLEVALARAGVKCAWAKEVWLDGIRHSRLLRQRLAEAERREVRVRTSLEDVAVSLAARQLGA